MDSSEIVVCRQFKLDNELNGMAGTDMGELRWTQWDNQIETQAQCPDELCCCIVPHLASWTRRWQLICNPYEPPSVTTLHACEQQINEKCHYHSVKYSFTSAAAFQSINSLDLDAELQWKRAFAVLLIGVTSKSNSFENSSTSVSEML